MGKTWCGQFVSCKLWLFSLHSVCHLCIAVTYSCKTLCIAWDFHSLDLELIQDPVPYVKFSKYRGYGWNQMKEGVLSNTIAVGVIQRIYRYILKPHERTPPGRRIFFLFFEQCNCYFVCFTTTTWTCGKEQPCNLWLNFPQRQKVVSVIVIVHSGDVGFKSKINTILCKIFFSL